MYENRGLKNEKQNGVQKTKTAGARMGNQISC
nr:MAG TPA: hypothetical protein [Caudoviricetes sp.]